jgi:ketosteroid isomerase-like protein
MGDDQRRADGAEQLDRVRAAVERATNQGDPTYVADHGVEDVVAMPASGDPRVGKEACTEAIAEFFAEYDVEIEYHSEEVVVGGLFAFDRGTASERVESKEYDEFLEHEMEYFWLYRKTDDGEWKQFRLVWKNVEW